MNTFVFYLYYRHICKKSNMNIKEKAGDFILDIAKLIFAGVILAGVVSENINRVWLYTIGCIVFVLCCILAALIYKMADKED